MFHLLNMNRAARDVLRERRRQVRGEGWEIEHDDLWSYDQLSRAAACYALGSGTVVRPLHGDTVDVVASLWPWSPVWWKPSTRRRDLVKAAALLLAEIERMDRKGGRS